MSGGTFLLHITPDRKAFLRDTAEDAGVTMSEMLRRMLDHCRQPRVLDELLPHLSGKGWGR